MNNWQFLWRNPFPLWKHGFYPEKGKKLLPVYEWWKIGPIEIRHFIPRSIDMEYLSLDLVRSNNKQVCLHCGAPITKDNDSGWEGFTEEGLTQPVCKSCDTKYANLELPKAAE